MLEPFAGILEQSMGARNRIDSMESISGSLKSLKIPPLDPAPQYKDPSTERK
jgi:hypothetical protein